MTAPDPTFCAAPGCRRAPTRTHLCTNHHQHIGQTLTDLADLLTADATTSLTAWRTGGARGGGLTSERDPGNLRYMTARADAAHMLAAWADWIRGARQLHTHHVARIEHRGGRLVVFRSPAPPNPEVDRKLLALHLDWILGQPEAGQFWCSMRSTWSELRGHRPVRRCTCGGPVWTEVGGGWCSWCGTPWTGADLLRLARNEDVA